MKYIIKYSYKEKNNNLDMIGNGNSIINLLSYNSYMRPPPVGIFSDLKNERLDYLIKNKFDKFDIICLQEMFSNLNNRRDRLKKEMKKRF